MQFLLALLYFSRCVMRMESLLLFHIAQKPVAGVLDRNRCRLHRDNAKQEVPGKKEFRQNKCVLHTPDCRLLHNGAAKILWGNFVEKLYQSNDLFITVSPFYPICHAYLFLIDIKRSIKNISVRTSVESLTLLVGGFF